jgi:tetratricopeptide (TPR) repeat protein
MSEILKSNSDGNEALRQANLKTTSGVILGWGIVSWLVVIGYAISFLPVWTVVLEVSAIATAISFCAASVGTVTGFLFGIPRTLQREMPVEAGVAQRVNTNLEQISDWLTKILVGVGLTQLQSLPAKLWRFSGNLGANIHDTGGFTLMLLLNFAVIGFFVGYLFTRLFLASAFYLVDSAGEAVKKLEVRTDQIVEMVKAMADTIIKKIMASPRAAEVRPDTADAQLLTTVSAHILRKPDAERSASDWLVVGYQALRSGSYEESVKRLQNALRASPSTDQLWSIHNLLGLAYHYLQPKNWKQGDALDWYEASKKHYNEALNLTDASAERAITMVNMAFLHLDAGKLTEAGVILESLFSQGFQGIDRSTLDIGHLAAAWLAIERNDTQSATGQLNAITNLEDFGYLFTGEDFPKKTVEAFEQLPTIKPEHKTFLGKAKSRHAG